MIQSLNIFTNIGILKYICIAMKRLKLPLVVKVLVAILPGVGLGHFMPGWVVRATNTFTGKMLLWTVALALYFKIRGEQLAEVTSLCTGSGSKQRGCPLYRSNYLVVYSPNNS